MDIFQTLSGGGAHFDKKRFQDDIELFQSKSQKASTSRVSLDLPNGKSRFLPKELDFFGDLKHSEADDRQVKANADAEDSEDKESEEDIAVAPITSQELPSYLKKFKIKQTGTDVSKPLASWLELETRWKVDSRLLQNLRKGGWSTPTAVQRGAMPVLLDNRDCLVGAPTGSGKTLTYLLPLLYHLKAPQKDGGGLRAIIVCPTKELSLQIYEQLDKLGEGKKWKLNLLTRSSEGSKMQDPQFKKKFDILITTPLRLVHAIEQNEVDLSNVRHLVLDEADRLLEEGFLEQTDAILAACTHSSLRKAMFSATLPSAIEELSKTFMIDEVRILVGSKDAAVESISQELLYVSSEDGKLLGLRNYLKKGALKPPILLFVQSIQRAQELFKELIYDDLHVDVIHSERPKIQREGVINAFKRGDVWLLICTEVLARGIDFKGVEVVVNYDFPQSRESYIHRIGRTGRAGRKGKAITFFTKDDAVYLKSVVNVMRQSGCEVPEWMVNLKSANQKQKKSLKRKAPERQDIKVVAGSTFGRKEANKRRDMIQASKKRREGDAKKASAVQ
jgi:ATP-dependent RNA helicase DDX52/ROK1